MRLSVCTFGLSSLALVSACAHRPAKQVEVEELNRSIEALRSQNTAYAKQVEELENRLFILNDRIESRKVNDEKVEVPKLPTVALHPVPAAAPQPTAPPGTETSAEPEVEYAGEAAKSTAHRPLLRMHGDSAELSLTRDSAVAPAALRVMREGTSRPARDESPEAVALYRKAYEALRGGRHEEAAQGFREFLRAHPGHDLADNSQYWLGECYYDRKDYTQAVREFRRVIEHYPSGNKVPDALLKVGFSYLALGSSEAGRQTLSQLQRSYPRHEASVLAASRLAELDRSTPVRAGGETARVAVPSTKDARVYEEAP
jgi:tol-pal system protein YbgF